MSYIILPPVLPFYNTTLGDMVDEVANHLRNDRIQAKIIRWINLEILHISSQYGFPELHSENILTTDPPGRTYPLASDLHWLKVMVDGTNRRYLRPVSEFLLARANPLYKTQTGQVTHYVLNANTINLYRIPTGVMQFYYSYYRRPLKMVSLTDICDIPMEWHPLITLKAAKRGLRREGRADEIPEVQADIAVMEKELRKSLYNRPDNDTVMSGPEELGDTRPWPVLPSSYPRTW